MKRIFASCILTKRTPLRVESGVHIVHVGTLSQMVHSVDIHFGLVLLLRVP